MLPDGSRLASGSGHHSAAFWTCSGSFGACGYDKNLLAMSYCGHCGKPQSELGSPPSRRSGASRHKDRDRRGDRHREYNDRWHPAAAQAHPFDPYTDQRYAEHHSQQIRAQSAAQSTPARAAQQQPQQPQQSQQRGQYGRSHSQRPPGDNSRDAAPGANYSSGAGSAAHGYGGRGGGADGGYYGGYNHYGKGASKGKSYT